LAAGRQYFRGAVALAAPPMRKLLIVSPRFPPTNAADMHRVRVSLALYRRYGWQPTVLCVDPATFDGSEDAMLARALPPDIRVVRIAAWNERKCRRFGFGQLGWRSLLPLYLAGTRLLREQHHDVVFFSTTVFTSFLLGRLWKRRFGCKIVYDFQDPWYSEAALYTRENVPGRWWKYRLDRLLARCFEPFALRAADHIITVSDDYVGALTRRYPWLDRSTFTTLPFGASAEDYALVAEFGIKQTIFMPDRSHLHWVYAGAVVPDMAPILTVLFESLAALSAREPEFAKMLRLDFVGTDYAGPDRAFKRVEPLARRLGVADLVRERPQRLPYFEALSLYQTCDAILIVGSVRADYTASKLLGCILAKKPILALFHRESLVAKIAQRFPNVFLATFDDSPSQSEFARQVAAGINWLRTCKFDAAVIDAEIKPWLADASTQAQCAIFDRL
jgi:hypothetical protein